MANDVDIEQEMITNGTDETFTFTTQDGRFQFTVKKEFVVNNNPNGSLYDLMITGKMPQFLHNPSGPALINLTTNRKEFYLNGRACDDETRKRIEHNTNFKDKFMDMLKNGA